MLNKLDTWHKTRQGYLTFGALELVLAYIFASWAIDSGNLIDYALAVILFVGALQNFVKFVRFQSEKVYVKATKRRSKKA